ncbi:MAG: calcium/proton exchanger [Gemmatimonadetes bacterium]|nr:calcium/proton exchanger [Gemmatimonadota bacterium]
MRILLFFLLLVPVSVFLELTHAAPLLVFTVAALAIVPLSMLLGKGTEEIAIHAGPTIGGFLNASLGNLAELIITILALREGLVDVAKASITGSILGNLLLILGASALVGGWKRVKQTFNRTAAGVYASMLVLAVVGLGIPSVFALTHPEPAGTPMRLSVLVAVLLLGIYFAQLWFSFRTHRSVIAPEAAEAHPPQWSRGKALGVLIGAALLIGLESEILVGVIEPTVEALGWSEVFLGLVIIPIIGNAAEHSTAIWVAAKNQMDLAMGIAIGSSTQVALLVAPVLVLLSLAMGTPMDLVFTPFEIVSLAMAVGIVTVISLDGETNWLEGAQLLTVYAILGVAFFYY